MQYEIEGRSSQLENLQTSNKALQINLTNKESELNIALEKAKKLQDFADKIKAESESERLSFKEKEDTYNRQVCIFLKNCRLPVVNRHIGFSL